MFERFTGRARLGVKRAQDEARQLGNSSIRPEHLLLGIAGVDGSAAQALASHGVTVDILRRRLAVLADDGLDPDALATLGIDLDRVRQATEANLGPGALDKLRPPVKPGHIPFSKEGKKVLELSLREAVRLKSGEIGTGHMLLGLLREGDPVVAQVLTQCRIDPDALRDEVAALMTEQAA